jgi:DNA polymerase-3 subunit gamma/tau
MALQWALKYRPETFADFSGQRPSVATLFRMAARGTLPDVMLFYGERGCGKTSMARVVAKALNCEAEAGKASETPCGKCPSCEAIARGISPDVIEIDAASNGSVDMVREVVRQASFGTAGSRKVYIIDEAHGVSSAGFDAMLKTLEELDGQVVFILCSTRPKSIPQTVRDRCRAGMFKFDALAPVVIRRRLEVICAAEGFAPEPGLLDAIAQAARGGMRDAIMRLEQVAAIGVTSLQMWRELTGETDFAPVLITAAADGDYPALYAGLDKALAAGDPGVVSSTLIRTLADLLVLATPGGTIAHAGEALAVREKLAARLGSPRIIAVLAVLWELQARVRTGDPAADLILACSQIARKLCPPPADQGPISTGASAAARLRQVLGEASERT